MTHAWRLTFAYDGDSFTLKSTLKLEKRVPAGQAADAKHSGKYVELRSAQRKVIYRRRISELLPDTVEYPTGDPEKPFGRAARKSGEVSILVPALAEGQTVAIVAAGRPLSDATRKQGAEAEAAIVRDLISVDLPRDAEPSGAAS